MRSALDALSEIPVSPGGRRVAILADVLESGENWKEIHEGIGRAVAASCVDLLICYGECARSIFQAAKGEGLRHSFYAESFDELKDLVSRKTASSDIVLFKGSHGMELERVVDELWGTWYYEESERHGLRSRTFNDEDFEYRVYSDHAAVVKKLSRKSAVAFPQLVEGLPITGIAENVFNRSRYTETIEFPETLRNIRYCAFYKANKLTYVDIPSSVRIIGDSAFSTCEQLREVRIASGCLHLGRRAFGNCPNLERIAIPETVCQIGDEAFLNCRSLTVFGSRGSYAEWYANSAGLPFSSIDSFLEEGKRMP